MPCRGGETPARATAVGGSSSAVLGTARALRPGEVLYSKTGASSAADDSGKADANCRRPSPELRARAAVSCRITPSGEPLSLIACSILHQARQWSWSLRR